jgi:ATP-dependent Clp protease protease subunit
VKHKDIPVDERVDTWLLESNVHFLVGDIIEANVTEAIKWILYANASKTNEGITMYINSPGGDLYQAMALIDVMNSSARPIRTVGVGQVMSAAFLIFASGTKGMRFVGKNTGIMCHQYSEVTEGKFHDLKASMQEGDRCNSRMQTIIELSTGMPAKKVKSLLLRESDVYLTAEQAVEYGIADHIMY